MGRPDVHWWAIIFIIKGVVLNIGFLFFEKGMEQIYWVMTVLLCYTCLVILYRPWRHMFVNALDTWAHLCLIMACSVMTWFATKRLNEKELVDLDDYMEDMALAWCFISLPMAIPVLLQMYWSQETSGGKKDKQRSMLIIRNAVRAGGEAKDDEFNKFLH